METMDAKHTFVICAYKESEYLEECVKSLLNQSVKSNILMTTSTDNEYIRNIANIYNIKLKIGKHSSDIARDWNFAYHSALTKYVTIVHQDDIYDADYLKTALSAMEGCKKPLIFFSQYYEIRNNKKVANNLNLRIKKVLLSPLKIKVFRCSRFIRRRSLSLGNPICCPAVTYNKNLLPSTLFHEGFKSNIDWEAWEKISKLKGDFVYCSKSLMGHRVHESSTTTQIINSNLRTKEDYEMLKKFWPVPFAKLINLFYKKAEQSNQ